MFAAHYHLSNLTAIVDNNGQQALGYTRDVLDQKNTIERWRAFGWQAVQIDGHSSQALRSALLAKSDTHPRVIIADTKAGYGVSFMESQVKWHYLPMTFSEYEQAKIEVERSS
jgi:transketolase